MQKELEYIYILKAIDEIPFGVGKKLLIEFLQGKETHDSIKKNKLHFCMNFGTMGYEVQELTYLIDNLIMNNMIKFVQVKNNKFWKVLELTEKGRNEIIEPTLHKRKLSSSFKQKETIITEQDKAAFKALEFFLNGYNDYQKKSIICNNSHILCIAGAGSGKTTVLTKRIEFLTKYRSQDAKKILAITFTRKARQEMISRLEHLADVHVETFNSFCEKILRKHNDLIYDKQVKVISYRDKFVIIKNALDSLKIGLPRVIDIYFSKGQRISKTNEQLGNIFMNDIFFLRDYFKFKNLPIEEESFDISSEHKQSFKLVLNICNYVEEFMKKNGYRDFADQLLDTISLFNKHPELIPKFDQILIDEYQDVNSTQIELVDILNSKNIFCVGDPRQSIYGWRGSDIKYIINFEEKYPNAEIITLTKNYRSTEHIVKLINKSITNMGLPDLESEIGGEKDIKLLKFNSEQKEFEFIIQKIISSPLSREEIFVLARTNRQLNDLSSMMKMRGIKHVLRSDEMRKSVIAGKEEITLATIHAIKGLEAEMVFVIGCSVINFPCKGSEHPIIDMVKVGEYDKEEEERRLFYVAMSRAKKTLYLSYCGKNPTYFMTKEMLSLIDKKEIDLKIKNSETKINGNCENLLTRLQDWRTQLSRELNIPPYIIMHDRTLLEIATKMPQTTYELETIYGVGPTKVMKYGEDLLELIK
jgi:superfamily I DNA/RNA helicase